MAESFDLPKGLQCENSLREAWNKFQVDRDHDALIAMAKAECRQWLDALQWLAIGTGDWCLEKVLQGHGVGLPPDRDDGAPLIYCILSAFGDVPESVRWLVGQGARLDLRGMNNWTCLHLASRQGYLRSVVALIDCGCDVNAITKIDGGWTPLMEACAGGHLAVVEALLAHGADPRLRNTFGDGTARDIAARHGHKQIAAFLEAYERRGLPAKTGEIQIKAKQNKSSRKGRH